MCEKKHMAINEQNTIFIYISEIRLEQSSLSISYYTGVSDHVRQLEVIHEIRCYLYSVTYLNKRNHIEATKKGKNSSTDRGRFHKINRGGV